MNTYNFCLSIHFDYRQSSSQRSYRDPLLSLEFLESGVITRGSPPAPPNLLQSCCHKMAKHQVSATSVSPEEYPYNIYSSSRRQ